MARKYYTTEQIIGHLRQAEVLLSQGKKMESVLREIGVTANTYYRWRKDYGGMGMDQAKKLKELEAENTRLKDQTLDLRSQNQDLTQRAVDDSRKITVQDEAVERLEKSVQAYQAERDKLAAAFETIKRQVQLSASPQPSAALGERLKSFATAHAGWAFEAKDGVLSVPADRLFEPATPRLKDGAGADLKALAGILKGLVSDGQTLEVVGRDGQGETGDVRKTALDGDRSPTAPGRFLATARAARVREALVTSSDLAPARVRLAPAPDADTLVPDGTAIPRVDLRVVPRAAGLDDGTSIDK